MPSVKMNSKNLVTEDSFSDYQKYEISETEIIPDNFPKKCCCDKFDLSSINECLKQFDFHIRNLIESMNAECRKNEEFLRNLEINSGYKNVKNVTKSKEKIRRSTFSLKKLHKKDKNHMNSPKIIYDFNYDKDTEESRKKKENKERDEIDRQLKFRSFIDTKELEDCDSDEKNIKNKNDYQKTVESKSYNELIENLIDNTNITSDDLSNIIEPINQDSNKKAKGNQKSKSGHRSFCCEYDFDHDEEITDESNSSKALKNITELNEIEKVDNLDISNEDSINDLNLINDIINESKPKKIGKRKLKKVKTISKLLQHKQPFHTSHCRPRRIINENKRHAF